METKEIVIIGTGYSGICMGIKLKAAGINDFIIFEKEKELGGTWYSNNYPGAECDVESHLYSFSFEPYDWPKVFSGQEVLNKYIKHCANKYDLIQHIKLNTSITSATYNEPEGIWEIITNKNETIKTKIIVTCVGGLSDPFCPDFKGIENFEGEKFHSARWNHSFDLKNKNVAVIGSAASAIQFVPQIAPQVKNLALFQRTANWILPKPDRIFKPWERKLLINFPLIRWLYRERLYWEKELRVIAFVKYPKVLKFASKASVKFINRYIKDPQKQKAMIPDYIMGCKRILLSNNWYPTINRQNVDVITDGVAQVNKNSITTTSGKEIPVDAIIFSTGFKATDPLSTIRIVGKGGIVLNDKLKRDGIEAYKGTVFAGYPNLFILFGPNTGIGHTSFIHMVESQAAYVMDAIKYIRGNGVKSCEIKQEVQNTFNDDLQLKLAGTVWNAGGCKSYYLDSKGRNPSLWPGFTFTFRKLLSNFDYKNYNIISK